MSHTQSMSALRLLLVDDDQALLEGIVGMLALRLPEVCVDAFTSPQEALAYLETEEVHTVMTDLAMPELSGLEFLRRAKAVRPAVSVIVCSGQMNGSVMAQALSLGAHDVLQKPFDREQLLAVLSRALQGGASQAIGNPA